MLEIPSILCPIDFSVTSRQAWDHAVAIAGWYGSKLTALHVCHPGITTVSELRYLEFPVPFELTDEDRQQLSAQFHPWLQVATAAGLATEVVFDAGQSPAILILERARTLPASLIVMGTHGRGGIERLMLGSVAEKVLRKAVCPVLTVPAPAAHAPTPPYKRILCPIDFFPSSLAALQFAFSIAKESDSALTILHALDWPTEDDLFAARFDTPEFRLEFERSTRHRIDALISEEVRTWCHPAAVIRYGKPYLAILELAELEHTDLIVMGVRGRLAVNTLLFGSTTNQVVRQASCPVLTLKQ
jgi:nucleotide-binding universal stress UspA family protein